MYKAIITLILSLYYLSIFAQDTIHLVNRDMIYAKVLSINEESISFKKHDNLEGPDYTINLNKVEKIVYKNGVVENYNKRQDQESFPVDNNVKVDRKFLYSDVDNYSRISLSAIISTPCKIEKYFDTMAGVQLGYLLGVNITKHRLPLFLEIGTEISYVTGLSKEKEQLFEKATNIHNQGFNVSASEKDEFYNYEKDPNVYSRITDPKYQILSISLPINLSYKFRVGKVISLSPFVGLNCRYNLLAKATSNNSNTISYVESEIPDMVTPTQIYKDIDSYSLFSDFGYEAKRFQMGINTGFGAYFSRLYLGIGYSHDLSEFISFSKNHSSRFEYYYTAIGIKL